MVHKTKQKLSKFDITPYGFAMTYTIEAKNEADATKKFIAFQKKNFKWSKGEWQEFLEVAMPEADVRKVE